MGPTSLGKAAGQPDGPIQLQSSPLQQNVIAVGTQSAEQVKATKFE